MREPEPLGRRLLEDMAPNQLTKRCSRPLRRELSHLCDEVRVRLSTQHGGSTDRELPLVRQGAQTLLNHVL